MVRSDDEMGSITSMTPGSPANNTLDLDGNADSNILMRKKQEKKFTDVNFWREPILDIDDLSDISQSDDENNTSNKGPENLTNAFKGKASEDSTKKNESRRFSLIGRSAPDRTDDVGTLHVRQNADENAYGKNFSTPKKNRRPSSKEEIGKQIYLELGSPLTSPRLNHIDSRDLDDHLKNFSISRPAPAIAGVSKVNVMDDNHSVTSDETSAHQPDHITNRNDEGEEDDSMDDEFDEDDFID